MPQDVSSPWIFTDIRQWNALIRTAETVSLEKDAIIYEQGERAEYVYVVKTGRVRLTSFLPNGREQIFMFIEEGGMFGEAELFEGGVRLTDANAITDVVLYRSTLHDFRKLINTDIDFSNSVLALTSRKFSRLVGMMQSLVFTDTYCRIAQMFLNLIEVYGVKTDEGYKLPYFATHQSIANLVTSSRVTVNKIMRRMIEEGLIRAENHNYIVLDVERLRQIVKSQYTLN